MGIRQPDFSGTWYPGTKDECIKSIKAYRNSLKPIPEEDYRGKGGIVPHAGWYFSGKTACSVYNGIRNKNNPDVFIIFGMHLPEYGSNYIFLDEGIETPVGIIVVNTLITERISKYFNFIIEDARHYTHDNTIELQLPFIKYLFPNATIVTMGVSPSDKAMEIGEKAALITQELGINACYIGSTDLTHYGPNYGFTSKGIGDKSVKWVKEVNDKKIVDAFTRADSSGVLREALNSQNACCPGAASAAIAAVRKIGINRGVLLDYTTSYDIHPDSSFVGYAGVVY